MLASLQLLTPLTAAVVGALAVTLLIGFALLRWLGGPPAAIARRWGLIGIRAAAVGTLLLILLNPSDVSQTPGPIDRPDIFYLLDSSQSMAVGDKETRFDHAARLMREADQATRDEAHAQVKLFRFGHRLAAVEDASPLGLGTGGSEDKTNDLRGLNSGRLLSLTSEAHAGQSTTPRGK